MDDVWIKHPLLPDSPPVRVPTSSLPDWQFSGWEQTDPPPPPADETFIPYDSAHRARATALLSEAADEFGGSVGAAPDTPPPPEPDPHPDTPPTAPPTDEAPATAGASALPDESPRRRRASTEESK